MTRTLTILFATVALLKAADAFPAPQKFRQETVTFVSSEKPQLLDSRDHQTLHFADGQWLKTQDLQAVEGLKAESKTEFVLLDGTGKAMRIDVPWPEVRQVLRWKEQVWVVTSNRLEALREGKLISLGWPKNYQVNQAAVDSKGTIWAASEAGLYRQDGGGWAPEKISDGVGRIWGVEDVLGVAFDSAGALWMACKAGVVRRDAKEVRFFEGKDGLPYNEFTFVSAGENGAVWFGTKLGLIRFQDDEWHYRQGPGWLPDDEILQVFADSSGAWALTLKGMARFEFKEMTLHEKAEHYEEEVAKHIKRTPYGFVAEAQLRIAGDRSTATQSDSDNDGLWTAMYGAGECFAYAATKDPKALERAKKAFEALRFLQKVTEASDPAPPKGYIARTVLPTSGPDPNAGRIERDREAQKSERLWKVYEPRWPKSADGKWYWKSDTSSDELDGHYFFYPLYFEFCAQDEQEKERVREVVRGITDHLIAHNYNLVDHDGKPTRWGIYGPSDLNRNPDWWGERGLKSLSILSYLAGAAYITGDEKYEKASRELIDKHGYAQNLMYAKVQHGPGSGNQSDDEMAVMCFYNLLRYSKDEALKAQARYSFYRYWANEAPEMNPFFNFAYAAHNRDASMNNPWGDFPIPPWKGWLDDGLKTLRGFPLDRVNWPRRNSHRLDIQLLSLERSVDLYEPRNHGRGHRVNGKVLPVENRYFTHWNTDPWRLDYGGDGGELGAGTVFLLPYYMGLYHGFIEKPN